MLKFIKNRLKGDRADSNLVSIVIVIPLIMAVFFGIIDASAYFTNRSQIYSAAHSGARTIAIMGGAGETLLRDSNGNGKFGEITKLQKEYGLTRSETCGALKNSSSDKAVAQVKKNGRPIECNIMAGIQDSSSFINITVNEINCNPAEAKSIGTRVSCEIKWTYAGTPGSALSMIKLFNENTTSASVESEVMSPGLVGGSLQVMNPGLVRGS